MENFLLFILPLIISPSAISGHGRLREPPSRASMWREPDFFPTPRNYDDNGLNCGGFKHQVEQGYKCGVCGDPYDGTRPHEAGGIFATGTISRAYQTDQMIDISVEITAHHKGWFEFRLCKNDNPSVKVNQECLDKYPLVLDNGNTRFQLPLDIGTTYPYTNWYYLKARLPSGLTCSQCVLQWKYHAGNSWGTDVSTGRSCVGCGLQEEFYGCADISISDDTNRAKTVKETTPDDSQDGNTEKPKSLADCHHFGPTPMYDIIPGMTEWCGYNCPKCPTSHCQCSEATTCKASGIFAGNPTVDKHCAQTCPGSDCQTQLCQCV